MINIQPASKPKTEIALFQLAFRPMFLLGPIAAIFGFLIWVTQYSGWYLAEAYWYKYYLRFGKFIT